MLGEKMVTCETMFVTVYCNTVCYLITEWVSTGRVLAAASNSVISIVNVESLQQNFIAKARLHTKDKFEQRS